MYWLKISHSKAKMELSPQRAKLEATGNVNRIRNSEHHSLCVPGPLPSHVFSGGHIWEENGRLQSILTQALEVIYGRKTEDFDPFSLKRWRSYMGGNGGLRSILTQALFSLSNPIAQPPPHKFFSTDCKG